MDGGEDSLRVLVPQLEAAVPHRMTFIDRLEPDLPIPPEALSEDHSLGAYVVCLPRKMRDHLDGYVPIEVADLRVGWSMRTDAMGARTVMLLEHPGLDGVRFRAAELQYLEGEDWWCTTPSVGWPAGTVVSLLHMFKRTFGRVVMLAHPGLPHPLWLRAALPPEPSPVDVVVQARAPDRVLPTNIHTECPWRFAQRFAPQVRQYYIRATESTLP